MNIIHWALHGLHGLWYIITRVLVAENKKLRNTIEALKAQPPLIQFVEVPAIAAIPFPRPPEIPPDFCVNINDPQSIFDLRFAPLPEPVVRVVNRDIIRVIDRPVPAETVLPPWIGPAFLSLIMIVTIVLVILQQCTRPPQRTFRYDTCGTCVTITNAYNKTVTSHKETITELELAINERDELSKKVEQEQCNAMRRLDKVKAEYETNQDSIETKARKAIDKAETKQRELLRETLELQNELNKKKTSADVAYKRLTDEATSQAANIEELEEQVTNLQREGKNAAQEISQLQNSKKQMQEKLTSLKTQSAKEAEAQKKDSEMIKKLQGEIRTLTTQQIGYATEDKIQKLTDENTHLQAKCKELQEEREEMLPEVKKFRNDHVQYTNEKRGRQADVMELLKTTKELELVKSEKASLEEQIARLQASRKEDEDRRLEEESSKAKQAQELAMVKEEQKRLEEKLRIATRPKHSKIRRQGGKDNQPSSLEPKQDHGELKSKPRSHDDNDDNNGDDGPGGSGSTIKAQDAHQVIQDGKHSETKQGTAQAVNAFSPQSTQAEFNTTTTGLTPIAPTTSNATTSSHPIASKYAAVPMPQEIYEIPEFLPAIDEYGLPFPQLARKPEDVRPGFQPERTGPPGRMKQYNRYLLHDYNSRRRSRAKNLGSQCSNFRFQKKLTTTDGDDLYSLVVVNPDQELVYATFDEYLDANGLRQDQQGVLHASQMKNVPTGPRALTGQSHPQPAKPQQPSDSDQSSSSTRRKHSPLNPMPGNTTPIFEQVRTSNIPAWNTSGALIVSQPRAPIQGLASIVPGATLPFVMNPALTKPTSQSTTQDASQPTQPTVETVLPPTVPNPQSPVRVKFPPPASSFFFDAPNLPASSTPPTPDSTQLPDNPSSRRNTLNSRNRRGSRRGSRSGSQSSAGRSSKMINMTNPWAEGKK